MPSPQASVRLSRSTAVVAAAVAFASGCGARCGCGCGCGSSGGGAVVAGSAADAAAAAFWLRRTAPMEGRRLTSPAGRATGVSGVGEGAGAAVGEVDPAGGAAWVGWVPGRGKAAAPERERSSTLTRSDSASIPESRSGRTARTMAISSTTCASGASRMSTSAWPKSSMLRTTRARPMVSARPAKRSSEDPDTAHSSGASGARKTWRRSSISSVASCWGPQPPAKSALRATSTALTSPSARASRTWANSGRAASAEPDATTWSRAESASRAEPRPRRTAASSATSSRWRPASALTDSSRACSVCAPRSRNSRCWVRLRIVGGHLLRVRRGEHEDDVARRLLERLQQRVGRRGREHVDLVDDVDLPAPRGAQPGVGHQVAHGVHTVVGGRIELVHVERAALGDLDARGAGAAGFAIDGGLAVERLGQNASRGRLAGPARTAEQVGVRHPVVAHGTAQRPHHVVLAPDLVESPRPETAVEGDKGGVGHAGRAYPRARRQDPISTSWSPPPVGLVVSRCSVRRPGWLRHPAIPAESCCLPTLTRFTSGRCAGPGHRTQHRARRGDQVSGSPRTRPYTTRTAHSAVSMTPFGTLERCAGAIGPWDPTTMRSASSSRRHPGDRLDGVRRHRVHLDPDGLLCRLQADLVKERLSGIQTAKADGPSRPTPTVAGGA